MKSAKAKGRRLQNEVAQLIKIRLGLPAPDVRPAIMGEGGTDIKLSTAAAQQFPFAIECKYHERLNIWGAIKQAENNAVSDLIPAVCFRRNRSDIYITLKFEDLLELIT